MRLVVVQGVAVAHQPGRRVVPGDGQGVAQRRGHPAQREARHHPVHHDVDATHAQGLHPVRCADGEVPCHRGRLLAAVRPRRFILAAGRQQVVFVHLRIPALALGRQVGDGHPVIVVLDGQGQGRRAHVSVRIRQGVGEHFTAHPAPGQRLEVTVVRVEGVGVGAVGIEHQAAVGPAQGARGHRRAIRPLHVVGDDVAIEDQVVLARHRQVDVAHRRRHVVQHHNIQPCTGRVAIEVRQHNVEALRQSPIICRFVMCFVIVQGVAVGHAANPCHRVVADAGHQQLISQRTGDPLGEGGQDLAIADQRHTSQRQALHSICRIECKGTALGQGCAIGG